jgi:hypothetical protein
LDRDAAPSMSPRRRHPYPTDCVEGQFAEVRAEGVLGSSPKIAHLGDAPSTPLLLQ